VQQQQALEQQLLQQQLGGIPFPSSSSHQQTQQGYPHQYQQQQQQPDKKQAIQRTVTTRQQLGGQRTVSTQVPSGGSTWKMGDTKSFKQSATPKPSARLTMTLPNAEQPQQSMSAVNLHLIKMVERATTDIYYDVQYIHDLLLSFRCFTSPTNLFDLLVQRYAAIPPEGASPGEVEAWAKSQKIIQLRVIIFLKRWIDGYHTDFDEEGMEEMLANFDKIVAHDEKQNSSNSNSNGNGNSNGVSDADTRFTSLLQRKRNTVPVASPVNTPQYPQPWFPASMETLEIADVQALELARQISLHQSTLFVAIHPREYLQYCAERGGAKGSCWVTVSGTTAEGGSSVLGEEIAPNLHAFARWSRALGRLVASDIVKHESKAKRVASLEKWTEVANHCLQLKNFDAVFNIMDGIRHPSIERLSETFKGLGASAVKTLEVLRVVVSKDGDFKQYREALSVSPPPTLPHFESVLEEMWFLECSSPKVLNGGIVNFFHYRQIARKVFTYQQCLPSPYLFKPVPPLQKMLNRPANELLDDEQLKRKSLSREEPNYY
jgi:son of sevenless-like protein